MCRDNQSNIAKSKYFLCVPLCLADSSRVLVPYDEALPVSAYQQHCTGKQPRTYELTKCCVEVEAVETIVLLSLPCCYLTG